MISVYLRATERLPKSFQKYQEGILKVNTQVKIYRWLTFLKKQISLEKYWCSTLPDFTHFPKSCYVKSHRDMLSCNMVYEYSNNKICLCASKIKYHETKTCWEMGVIIDVLFKFELQEVEWSVSRSVRLTPEEEASSTRWIGSWVGPRIVLGGMGKIKFSAQSVPESSFQPVRT
jgi:hypothetical protein